MFWWKFIFFMNKKHRTSTQANFSDWPLSVGTFQGQWNTINETTEHNNNNCLESQLAGVKPFGYSHVWPWNWTRDYQQQIQRVNWTGLQPGNAGSKAKLPKFLLYLDSHCVLASVCTYRQFCQRSIHHHPTLCPLSLRFDITRKLIIRYLPELNIKYLWQPWHYISRTRHSTFPSLNRDENIFLLIDVTWRMKYICLCPSRVFGVRTKRTYFQRTYYSDSWSFPF